MAFEYDLEDSLPDIFRDALGIDIIEFIVGFDVEAIRTGPISVCFWSKSGHHE
jgi:hypothetical protein